MHIILHQPEIPSNTGNIFDGCKKTPYRLYSNVHHKGTFRKWRNYERIYGLYYGKTQTKYRKERGRAGRPGCISIFNSNIIQTCEKRIIRGAEIAESLLKQDS